MLLHDGFVNTRQLGANLSESDARSQASEEFGHAMDASGDHGRRQVMRTGHDVADDLSLRGIRNRRFQHSDDSCGSRADRVQPDGFANHGWIALESSRPETVSKH